MTGYTEQELLGRSPRLLQGPHTDPQVLQRLQTVLAPRLDACGPNEITQLLRGLDGRFIPPGPSGAPSRGRPDVLPTGRNFYSVDTRAVPTPAAYNMGAQAANRVIERHLQDHGSFPTSVGLSVWGTSTMRTGGEDVAQALALMGVRPKWVTGSHRVADIEVLPMAMRNRPRVDVTLRISGFFRDAFPNLIDLFDTAVQAVAAVSADDEPDDVNPIRARVQREAAQAQAQWLDEDQARRQATLRYGTGRILVMDDDPNICALTGNMLDYDDADQIAATLIYHLNVIRARELNDQKEGSDA
jgi:cobaltochelatase CobN